LKIKIFFGQRSSPAKKTGGTDAKGKRAKNRELGAGLAAFHGKQALADLHQFPPWAGNIDTDIHACEKAAVGRRAGTRIGYYKKSLSRTLMQPLKGLLPWWAILDSNQ
tara:strand:+ start:189 stop:512 length:324 start_codon:yes stop_codon:yes gene_type:complete